jgi:molybdopterin synthase catalytic subunit
VFLGTVRADPDVDALDYEVYTPMAVRTLTDLVDQAKAKFGVLGMSIVHRVGRVPVGGDSAVIACAAVHRAEAFAACAWAMEEVKRIVPIWKRESGPRAPRARRPRSGARRKAR